MNLLYTHVDHSVSFENGSTLCFDVDRPSHVSVIQFEQSRSDYCLNGSHRTFTEVCVYVGLNW